jgi:5-methylcytosine-specific restriction endonuclease McrA
VLASSHGDNALSHNAVVRNVGRPALDWSALAAAATAVPFQTSATPSTSPEGRRKRAAQQARRVSRFRSNGPRGVYTRLDVFERDGWRCHVCGDAVDPALRWPDPECAVVDHVVAAWQGGTDTLDNVACAHNHCNGDRNNIRSPDALRLMRERRKARLLICEAEGLPRRASRSDRALAAARTSSRCA